VGKEGVISLSAAERKEKERGKVLLRRREEKRKIKGATLFEEGKGEERGSLSVVGETKPSSYREGGSRHIAT